MVEVPPGDCITVLADPLSRIKRDVVDPDLGLSIYGLVKAD